MLDQTKVAIRASTQDHLEIEDIKDGIVILKDGGACLVLTTTAVNFGLLSEKEQEATIYAYAALLNSLTFSIQVLIRSSRKDISSYLQLLEAREEKEKRPLIKEQIQKYRQFVKETIQKNNVLDKDFYLIIPMSSLEASATKALASKLSPKKGFFFDKKSLLEKAKVNLYPKRDHLFRQLNRLGLKSQQINTQDLIKLFFTIYNPGLSHQQMEEEYQTTLIETIRKDKAVEKAQTNQEKIQSAPISQANNQPAVQTEPQTRLKPEADQEKPVDLSQESSINQESQEKNKNLQDKINDLVKGSVS